MKKRSKGRTRVFVGGDMHCGHRVGLTPPGWAWKLNSTNPEEEIPPHRVKYARIQQECWRVFMKMMTPLRPFDVAILTGDLLDGKGSRSGGTEQITSDRTAQVDMADKVITLIGASENVLVRGTPYHTGQEEDWEDDIAARHDAKIGDHEYIDINGVIFDVKHHLSSSSVPYGRHTPLSKEDVWNSLWTEAGYAPRADWLIRAHGHVCVWGGRLVGPREVNFVSCPALQAMGTKFGARRCSGLVDFGFLHYDVWDDGNVDFYKHWAFIESQKATVTQLGRKEQE